MVVTYYAINGQGPGVTNPVLDDRITDDKFCIAFEVQDANEGDVDNFKKFLSDSGASEISTKTI